MSCCAWCLLRHFGSKCVRFQGVSRVRRTRIQSVDCLDAVPCQSLHGQLPVALVFAPPVHDTADVLTIGETWDRHPGADRQSVPEGARWACGRGPWHSGLRGFLWQTSDVETLETVAITSIARDKEGAPREL